MIMIHLGGMASTGYIIVIIMTRLYILWLIVIVDTTLWEYHKTVHMHFCSFLTTIHAAQLACLLQARFYYAKL